MDPLQWFQQNVINKVPKGGAMPKAGGAIVPTGAGQLLKPTGIQQITTNLRVPTGGAVPGGGIGILGARGQNFGLLDRPIDMLGRLILRQDAFIPPTQKKEETLVPPVSPPAAGLDTGTGKKDVKDPMAIWAEKYKDTLAPKVKQGQSGYDTIQDVLGASTQDERDAASDRMVMGGNAAESMAGAKGANLEVVIDGSGPETVTIKPQEFKDSAMGKILNNYKNPNVTPLVEGMTLPTTTDYTGAFNQADMNTVNIFKDTGVMDEISRTYGGNTPSYTQGRNFRSLF
jgi:hypothetical protein